MDSGPGDRLVEVMTRLDAARVEFDAQRRRYEAAMVRLRVTLDQVRNGRSQREILHDSAYARLQARLDTLPVIEQAKGIVMAQRQCGPEDAFDLLRRASQSANVKVSVLAERIVEQAAARDSRTGGQRSAGRVSGRARRPALRSAR
jgi:hypothetical protein